MTIPHSGTRAAKRLLFWKRFCVHPTENPNVTKYPAPLSLARRQVEDPAVFWRSAAAG